MSIECNGVRPSHRDDGVSEEGCPYTLNTIEQHKVAYGIGNGQSQAALNADKELCKTLDYMHDHQAIAMCYENHAQDSRVKPIEVAPTIPQKAGTGGNNLPLVAHTTNSNGGDVMPTLTNELAKQTGNQQAVSGGYIIHEL